MTSDTLILLIVALYILMIVAFALGWHFSRAKWKQYGYNAGYCDRWIESQKEAEKRDRARRERNGQFKAKATREEHA